jgi:hypothetical protein
MQHKQNDRIDLALIYGGFPLKLLCTLFFTLLIVAGIEEGVGGGTRSRTVPLSV